VIIGYGSNTLYLFYFLLRVLEALGVCTVCPVRLIFSVTDICVKTLFLHSYYLLMMFHSFTSEMNIQNREIMKNRHILWIP
jgi:hypothetical protein